MAYGLHVHNMSTLLGGSWTNMRKTNANKL